MADKTRTPTPIYQRVGSSIWAFFSSVKLTIFILISAAITSIIGTVITQGEPVESYYTEYGERWGAVIRILQLHDMYHSQWFTAILILLVINIVACTIERFPLKWKTLLKEDARFPPSLIDKLSNNEKHEFSCESKKAEDRIFGILKKRRYKVNSWDGEKGVSGTPGMVLIYATKGLMGRFGSEFVHLSLLIILAGSIAGSFWGYKDFKAIYVGGSAEVPDKNFGIRLDNFWIDYYDSGQIRQYNSLLTVVEDGKDVFTKQIWVNEPLYYKGVRFYQSSYGTAWDRVSEAEVALRRKDIDKTYEPTMIEWGELKKIPETSYSVKVISYIADFAFDEKTNTIYSKSGEANNPAVRIEVYEGDKLIYRPWLFYNYPGAVETLPDSRYDLVFTGFRSVKYSGISVTKDPGTNIVWLGTAVMGIGFILAFFVYHRRIWISIASGSAGGTVKLGGMINKNALAFEKEFKEIVEELKSSITAEGKP